MNLIKKLFFKKNKTHAASRLQPRAEVSGVAIAVSPDLVQLTPGLNIAAKLDILDKSFNVDLKISRKTESIIAFNFIAPDAEIIAELSRIFLLEFNAQTINYIGPEKLQAVAEGTPHWYYGGENYELYYVEHAGVVKQFQIKILSDTIEKKLNQKIKYGRLWNETIDEINDVPKYKGSDLIEPQKTLPASVIKNAASFVSHISKIPKVHQEQIINELKI